VEPYRDRRAAGAELAGHLAHHHDPLVVAIPAGGLIMGEEIVGTIGGRLAVAPVFRLGSPESPDLVIGAIGPAGPPVLDEDLTARLGIDDADLGAQVARARAAVAAELEALGAATPGVAGEDVIIVAEGAASGLAIRAVLAGFRPTGPAGLSCAIGVAPPATVDLLAGEVDEVVCLRQPLRLGSIQDWYEQAPPSVEEVRAVLRRRR
jgi:predicted phosphoribosyltransferase